MRGCRMLSQEGGELARSGTVMVGAGLPQEAGRAEVPPATARTAFVLRHHHVP